MTADAPARLGKYRLVRRLAVGGMAEVYLAVAEGPHGFAKRVVLKRLLPQHARDRNLHAMFVDEARLLAGIRHPNIAEVYDVGEEGAETFFAMEHVAGEDVHEILRAAGGGPLPLAVSLAVVAGTAAGLDHAHGRTDAAGRPQGIVHRDVSPSNVLVSFSGDVKVIDFGVAKWTAQRSQTRHGFVKGKVAYMSPEQCRAEELDRRSDVFALGVLLYELTTGRRPFAAESDFEIMTAIVDGRVSAPSAHARGYPAALEAIVMRALARSRAERFESAAALREALLAFAARERLDVSASALAAFMSGAFGVDAARRKDEDDRRAIEAGGPGDAPASAPAPRGATGAGAAASGALDRTLTDAARVPAGPGDGAKTGERPSAAGRRGMIVGVALAAGAALAVGVWSRRAPPAPAASSPAAVASVRGEARVAASVAPAVDAAPVAAGERGDGVVGAAGERGDGVVGAAGASGTRARAAASRLRAPVAGRPGGGSGATVKVWDPDSPVPP